MPVDETLRTLSALEQVHVATRSADVISLVLACATLACREAVTNGADIDELALALATAGLSVTAASLFDTTDERLQPLSALYREYSRADFCAVRLDAGRRV